MAVLLGGPSFPSPSQAGLWLTSATACCCHKPPVASSFREKHLVQSLPPCTSPPPVHLPGHRNHVCLTIYKTSPSWYFTAGAGQCPAGPRPPHWAQPGAGACHLVPGSCQCWQEQV